MKSKERCEARRLRVDKQLSISKIADLVGVSKSTVSLWVRDIPVKLSSDVNLRINREKARKTRLSNGIENRKQLQCLGRKMAHELKSDIDFVAGCVAYWAEGSKSRAEVSMSNTDPNMLLLFIRFLVKFFDVRNEQFSIFCRYYTDLTRVGEPEKYWIDTLLLPDTCLRKSCVNYYPKNNAMVKRKYSHGKLQYGTCRVKINSVEISQKIYGAIQELMGFDEPKWLL